MVTLAEVRESLILNIGLIKLTKDMKRLKIEWIKCEDQLPKYGEKVLIGSKSSVFGRGGVFIGKLLRVETNKLGTSFVWEYENPTYNARLKYWSPLPYCPED